MVVKQVLLKTALALLIIAVAFPRAIGPTEKPEATENTADRVHFWLTLLHNNDGESQLINAGTTLQGFGGVARFAALVSRLKRKAAEPARRGPFGRPRPKSGVLMVSSGDNFLAGPEFNASLRKGVPFYDAIAMDLIGYHAIAIGNHEFDFGPDVLADFILGFPSSPAPFLSANLDVSREPRLQALADQGRIVRSTVVEAGGERLGIVGATTPRLASISSPRNVSVNPDVAAAVQAEVDRLAATGLNKIMLISHLQSVQEDLALAPLLRGVDIMVAGGGGELLANPGNLLLPGDERAVFGPYPLFAPDADGLAVPVITTSGGYRYVGRLVVGFDRRGDILLVDELNSGPVRVAGGGNPDAVAPDPLVKALVTDPVEAAVAALASTVIGSTEVPLDGLRSSVRTKETNTGNLVADALLFQARALAKPFGAPTPHVALQNGGGIRNNAMIPVGNITERTLFDTLPFANFVAIIPEVSPTHFKEILENAVSRVEFTDGRFAQIAGFRFVWDPAGRPQVLDAEGHVITPGTRVRAVVLDDGAVIVQDGAVVPGIPGLNIATVGFLARGGDHYPFRGAPFVTLGVTYRQALRHYIEQALTGIITAAQYPEGGEGRIKAVGRGAAPMPQLRPSPAGEGG
jgi:2',3'-cyclic-nucleotide 2'-phosphodiesterase (5'-nucleotidase family)